MMNNHFKGVLAAVSVSLMVGACSSSNGGSGTSNPSGPSAAAVAAPITIDTAGLVPVTNGSTTSVVYVHNNTTKRIDNIGYNAQVNVPIKDLDSQNALQRMFSSVKKALGIKSMGGDIGGFLKVGSVQQCSSIAAGQSCALAFVTPELLENSSQGSALVTAKYNYDGDKEFSQIINFAKVSNNSDKGAVFNSGALVRGFGNNKGYATVYLYGSGVNQVYTVTEMKSNKQGVKIVNGDITNERIASNFVQAVEVEAETINEVGYDFNLTAMSSANSQMFSTMASGGVAPSGSGAILTSSVVPLINSAVAQPGGVLYIVNAGNQAATGIAPTFGSGISSGSGSTCTTTLAAGGRCEINFNVTQNSGSANIGVTYSGGAPGYSSITQTVTWYNGVGGALLQMSVSSNPIIFAATLSESATVTVTNIGGYNLSSMTVPLPTINSGSVTASTSNSTCTGTLAIGASCTYVVTVSGNTNGAGEVLLRIGGTYNNGSVVSYTRGLAMGVLVNSNSPSFSVTPNPVSMTINGDGVESVTQVLTITNNGTGAGTVSASTLLSNPAYLTKTVDNCSGQLIPTGGSCTVSVKLGTYLTAAGESGTAQYRVTYSGGEVSSGNATSAINYTVTPNTQNLTIQSVTATNNTTTPGQTGSSANPFLFSGGNTGTQVVTITYVNSGTNAVSITGITNTINPAQWSIESGSSTCDDAGVLAVGATCTIVYQNVLQQNLPTGTSVGPSTPTPITVPSLVFSESTSGAQFTAQPAAPAPINSTTISANNLLATITNAVIESAGTVTVQSTFIPPSGGGYSLPFVVASEFEDYFTGSPVATGCTSASQGAGTGIMTQTCTLTPSGTSTVVSSVRYTESSSYQGNGMAISALFRLTNANGQAVNMNLAAGASIP